MPRNGAAPPGGFRSVKSAHRIKKSTCFDPSTRLAAEEEQETVASGQFLRLAWRLSRPPAHLSWVSRALCAHGTVIYYRTGSALDYVSFRGS
ncbi:uncharacterized protein B0H64DRAFT_392798 [Chaetomium fimeti]|uniref:Uncharacterized protein n=1 Tax=Chaetomium fimeti TaxID=1854472 RepID=A0AAE0HK33_9PEZI|nr:hypothetical protein B0H64DRAFT_392798 [Chaetomium fimeti]